MRAQATSRSEGRGELPAGTPLAVAETKRDGELVEGSAVWYRITQPREGWVHSSGVVGGDRGEAGPA